MLVVESSEEVEIGSALLLAAKADLTYASANPRALNELMIDIFEKVENVAQVCEVERKCKFAK